MTPTTDARPEPITDRAAANTGRPSGRRPHSKLDRLWWRVLHEVFWRDVFYAILPLIVSFVVAGLMTADFFEPLTSPEWLFAAIVLLGVSIAQLNERHHNAFTGRNERGPAAALLLLLVIISSVILGLIMYQRKKEVAEATTWLIAVVQIGIFIYSFYNLWLLNYRREKAKARWEDSLLDQVDGPSLPDDMPDSEIVANVQATLEVAREHMSLLGRALSARPSIAAVADGNGEYWRLDKKNLHAQVSNFIEEAEALRSRLRQGQST